MQESFTSFRAEHIQKSFFTRNFFSKKKSAKKEVLKDICFHAKPGECIGILGANGCGKSTLLSILAGLQTADSGTIFYNDIPLFSSTRPFSNLCPEQTGSVSSIKKQDAHALIGYVPQEPPLIPELNALDNLKLWFAGQPQPLKDALKDDFLSILGISEFLNVPVKKMSGGMKKRLAIGCCTAGNPNILLLDEPGAALDLPCKERIETYLKNYKQKGNAILITTHEEREIRICDTLYILKNGVLSPYQYDGNIHHAAAEILRQTDSSSTIK